MGADRGGWREAFSVNLRSGLLARKMTVEAAGSQRTDSQMGRVEYRKDKDRTHPG